MAITRNNRLVSVAPSAHTAGNKKAEFLLPSSVFFFFFFIIASSAAPHVDNIPKTRSCFAYRGDLQTGRRDWSLVTMGFLAVDKKG